MPSHRTRLAGWRDLEVLGEIEVAAGERYRDYGLDDVADDEPIPVPVLARYADDGRAWVAEDDAGRPVGYLLVDVVDDGAHIEQVSVMPDRQGQGIGRALIGEARRWAAARGLSALTLTTFDHVPWNRPLYEHLGFEVVTLDEIGPGLQAVRAAETAHGLDPALRVVMRQRL